MRYADTSCFIEQNKFLSFYFILLIFIFIYLFFVWKEKKKRLTSRWILVTFFFHFESAVDVLLGLILLSVFRLWSCFLGLCLNIPPSTFTQCYPNSCLLFFSYENFLLQAEQKPFLLLSPFGLSKKWTDKNWR